MKKLLVLGAAFALACCGTLSLPDLNPPAQTDASIQASAPAPSSGSAASGSTAATPAPASTALTAVFDARATYVSAFLVPAAHYRQLPLCGPSSPTICADPAVIQKLQAADKTAKAALDAAEAIARGTATGDFSAVLDKASGLVSVAENLLVQFNIH